MRIYVPVESDLGPREIAAMRRLSRGSLAIIVNELHEPISRSTVKRVLGSSDPEREIAKQVAIEIERAVSAIHTVRAAGLGDHEYDEMELVDAGFGGFFKKVGKAIKKVAKKVVEVHKKVIDKTIKPAIKATVKVAKKSVEITKNTVKKVIEVQKKVIKKIGKAIKPYIPVIIGIAGAILAPFTGGASLAVAAALNAGYAIAMKAKQAREAKKMNKAAAAQMQAEVNAQSADLNRQLDELFTQNQGIFAAAGISQSAWNGMSLEERLAVVERINSGNMPSSQENADAAAEAQGVPPTTQSSSWSQAIQSSPVLQQWRDAAGDADAATAGVQTPTGTYDVYVEGRKVGTGRTLDEASALLAGSSKAGDRIEVLLDGRSLGLKVVTSGGGVIAIPADQAAAVRSMSRSEVDAMLARAGQTVVSTSSSGSSGGALLLLAVPAAILAAMAAKG